jgi:hypothetical protein
MPALTSLNPKNGKGAPPSSTSVGAPQSSASRARLAAFVEAGYIREARTRYGGLGRSLAGTARLARASQTPRRPCLG